MADGDGPLDLSVKVHNTWTEARIPSANRDAMQEDLADTGVQLSHQRPLKPPYMYVGMVAVAIYTSPQQMLMVADIRQAIRSMFSYFREEHRVSRTTISSVLSHYSCFQRLGKRLRNCCWTVDLSLLPPNALLRSQVKASERTIWAPTLTCQLRIADIHIPSPDVQRLSHKKTTPNKHQPAKKTPSSSRSFTASILGVRDTKPVRLNDSDDDLHNRSYINMFQYKNLQIHNTQLDQDVTAVMKVETNQHRSCKLNPTLAEPTFSQYGAMLYESITTSATTSAQIHPRMCPAPSYIETRPLSVHPSLPQTYPDPEPLVQCVCHEYFRVHDPQPVFRLNLEDWNQGSMY